MAFTLTAITDAATMVLYDPGAVPHLVPGEEYDIEAEAERGNLIAYLLGGDGEASFRIFVDEPADPEIARRAEKVVVGVLRVPTGRLVASGAEYVPYEGTAEQSLPGGSEHAVPPGNYEVRAFEIDWGEDADDAAENAARRASRSGAAILNVLGPVTGCLIFVSIFGVAVSGCFLLTGTLRPDLAWSVLETYGPWLLGLGIAVLIAWRVTPASKAERALVAAYDTFPRAAISLQRLANAEEIANRKGCRFGVGVAAD